MIDRKTDIRLTTVAAELDKLLPRTIHMAQIYMCAIALLENIDALRKIHDPKAREKLSN